MEKNPFNFSDDGQDEVYVRYRFRVHIPSLHVQLHLRRKSRRQAALYPNHLVPGKELQTKVQWQTLNVITLRL